MVANGREAAKEQKRISAEKQAEEEAKKAEEAKLAAVRKAEEERKKASSVQPGVPIGTTEVTDDEKVVYLTFDDGPSENTEEILKILEKYNVKATFFITGEDKSHRYLIKEAYTEVRKPSASTNVLRTMSRSTFLIRAFSLGCLLSSSMLFMKISRHLCNEAAKSYSCSVGDVPVSSSYPYRLPYSPRYMSHNSTSFRYTWLAGSSFAGTSSKINGSKNLPSSASVRM